MKKFIVILFLLNLCVLLHAQTKFGVLVNGRMSVEQKIKVAEDLGVHYVRDAVILQNWNGSDASCDRYMSAGLKVVLNVNWGQVRGAGGEKSPVAFPTDTNTYKKVLGEVLDKYKPELVVVENEEMVKKYHSGPVEDYINELAAAINVAHSKGLKVTNGGFTNRELGLLVYNDFLERGLKKEADDFAAHSIKPGLVRTDNPEGKDMLAKAKKLVEAYKNLPLDYVNIHIYEPIKNMTGGTDESAQQITPGAIKAIVNYMQRITGKKIISNESGARTSSPVVVSQMLKEFSDAGVDYLIWFSGDGEGGAVGLQNEYGSLRPNGEAFKKFVTTYKQ